MQLADILIWFNNYSKNNSNYTLNKANWESLVNGDTVETEGDWIEGVIIKVENAYGTFKPNNDYKTITVMPSFMEKFEIVLGTKLNVTTKPSRCGKKTHIDKLEVIK